jgi:hypothetical protein
MSPQSSSRCRPCLLLLGGDLYTACTFITVRALLFGAGSDKTTAGDYHYQPAD